MTRRSEKGAELLEIARSMQPRLRERVETAERDARVPAETMSELIGSGLFKAGLAARYGGYEIPLGELCEIIATLGEACASTAWVYGVMSDHNISVGMFEPQVQEEIWGENPDALISSCLMPAGKAVRVDGGFLLSGQWRFCSGCDYADWIFVGSVPTNDAGGDPEPPRLFLIPRSEFEFVDTWQVMGLAATGSKDIRLENELFVAEHRSLGLHTAADGSGPGGDYHPNPLYRLPRHACVPFTLAAPAIGIAQGAVDIYREWASDRVTRGNRLAEQGAVQLRLAQSSAEVDAARLLIERSCAESMEIVGGGEKLTMAQRGRNRRDMGFAAQLCVQAVDRVHGGMGGTGIYLESEIQRKLRDAHAVGVHSALVWDVAASTYAQIEFGLPPTSPMV